MGMEAEQGWESAFDRSREHGETLGMAGIVHCNGRRAALVGLRSFAGRVWWIFAMRMEVLLALTLS